MQVIYSRHIEVNMCRVGGRRGGIDVFTSCQKDIFYINFSNHAGKLRWHVIKLT